MRELAAVVEALGLERTFNLATDEVALIEEAMKLTGRGDAKEIVRVALEELVERQRFLNWVANRRDA